NERGDRGAESGRRRYARGMNAGLRTPIAALPERVELYVRTYRTLLRSAGETRLRILEMPHIEMQSSLHAGAGEPRPDLGALIYAVQRLPPCMPRIGRLVFGQSVEALS